MKVFVNLPKFKVVLVFFVLFCFFQRETYLQNEVSHWLEIWSNLREAMVIGEEIVQVIPSQFQTSFDH